MDTMTMDTTGSETGASTETKSTESTGQGQVESQGSQEQTDIAGDSQENSESGKGQGTDTRRPFRSKNQTIFELRQSLRERDSQIKSIEDRLSQFEQRFQPRQERKPSRTFWEAPEEVIDERMTNHLSEMEKRIYEKMEARDTQSQQATQWKQELSEAAKLIRSDKTIGEEGIAEIRELLVTNPVLQQLEASPMAQAEYALHLWRQDKGITDKSGLKQKAAGVAGSSTAGQTGPKMWSEAEMEQELKKFPNNPALWTKDHQTKFDALDAEFKRAYRENRVRK